MGLSNEHQISELIKKGSDAVESRGDSGTHTYYSYVDSDGVSAGDITTPKYNENELRKAVDLNIDELILPTDARRILTVPKEVYDNLLAELENLRAQLNAANEQIGNLELDISELQSQIETLISEVDVARNLQAAAESQLEVFNEKYIKLTEDFQSALTKGILESIERASLNSQVVGLQAQVDSLSLQLNGKLARIQEGAKAGARITARVLDKTDIKYGDLVFRARRKDAGLGRWVNGPEIEIFNFSDEPIEVRIEEVSVTKENIFTYPESFTLEPQQFKYVKIGTNTDVVDLLKPTRFVNRAASILRTDSDVLNLLASALNPLSYVVGVNNWLGGDKSYKGALNIITGTIEDGNQSVISFSTDIQKHTGPKYTDRG